MSIETVSGGLGFQRAFRGQVTTRRSVDYDVARRLWNGDIDRKPLAVVRPVDDADVALAVRFAADAGLPLAVRGGGHSYPGHSMCDDGITIDLAGIREITVDPERHYVRAGGGALLGTVDSATLPLGEVMPAGIVSHTGLGGLALGGGVGYLTRSLGLTCDQFLRLRVVTAAGEVLHASAEENPDLFWALRGGGGNFGIVTEFECRTHTLGPLQSGSLIYRMSDAPDVILALAEVVQQMPTSVSVAFSLGIEASRFPGAAELVGGERVLAVIVVFRGEPDDPVLTELRNVRPPLLDLVGPKDFGELQTMSDDIAVRGIGWYMKSGHTRSVSRDLATWVSADAVDYRENVSSPLVTREVYTVQALGGAVEDVPEDATAYSGRAARWHVAIEAGFTTPGERARIVPRIREGWQRTRSLLDMTTSYVNLNFEEGTEPLAAVFGPAKLERLRRIKTELDPENLFRHNFNITPHARVTASRDTTADHGTPGRKRG